MSKRWLYHRNPFPSSSAMVVVAFTADEILLDGPFCILKQDEEIVVRLCLQPGEFVVREGALTA